MGAAASKLCKGKNKVPLEEPIKSSLVKSSPIRQVPNEEESKQVTPVTINTNINKTQGGETVSTLKKSTTVDE